MNSLGLSNLVGDGDRSWIEARNPGLKRDRHRATGPWSKACAAIVTLRVVACNQIASEVNGRGRRIIWVVE